MAGLMETTHSHAPRFLCAASSGGTLNNCVMEVGEVTIDANVIMGIKIGFFMGFFVGAALPTILWFIWARDNKINKGDKK